MDKIQLKALAKINLGLDVLRRREDGDDLFYADRYLR